MYTVQESSDIRQNLPVGTILHKQDPRVCREYPSSAFRLRAGDRVAISELNRGYKVYEVVDPDVMFSGAPCFTVKAGKSRPKRPLQHGADLVHKVDLTPADAPYQARGNRKR
jgi:hypothetical protein